MKNKNIMIGIGLFFLSAAFVPVLSATTTAEQTVPVQEMLVVPSQGATESVPTASDSSMIKKSDYTLPYPGILPNHPLYFIKKFRDQIIELLVADAQRKADFYLLQSDKLIASSVLLEAQGQTSLAQSTLDLSAQRMTDSVSQLTRSKQNGQSVSAGTIDRMQQAIEKHLEVEDDLAAKKTVDTTASRSQLLQAEEAVMKFKN